MDAHFYIGAMAEELTVPESERSAALERVANLGARLCAQLPYVRQVRPFGSMLRGTALARRVNPNLDVDCLICMRFDAARTRFPSVSRPQADLSVSREICEALESTGLLSRVTLDHPWIECELDGLRLELSVAMQDDEGDVFAMFIRDTVWGRAHPALWEPYGGNTVSNAKEGEDSRVLLAMIEPFYINLNVLTETGLLRFIGLVLILKYWNLLYREGIPSFILERNVVKWTDKDRMTGTRSVFETVCKFLRNDSNYDSALFHSTQSFALMKEAFGEAEMRMTRGEEEKAVAFLNAVLPWPAQFQQFGPYQGSGPESVRQRMTELRNVLDGR